MYIGNSTLAIVHNNDFKSSFGNVIVGISENNVK